MRQTFRIELDDGESVEAAADARDVRAWEAAYGKSFFSTPTSYTEIAQIAYLAAKRTGALNGRYPTYDEFDRHCVEVTGVRPVVAADPTRPAPMDGSFAP